MKRTHSIWTQLVAATCAALVACGDPNTGSRSAAIEDDPEVSPPLTPPPDGPVHVPEGSIVPGQEVGTLPGKLSVTSSGTAAYDIPLRVPQGRAGIQPALALTFNDSNSNGLLGVGWSLAGLSRIAPCAQTTAQDGAPDAVHFAAGDQYCLGGTRLVAVEGIAGRDGTVYRLERDDLTKVVSRGSHASGVPDRFIAHHPDGTRWIYSKQIEAKQVEHEDVAGASPTERTVVWAWMLERVEDRIGNRMTFDYDVSHGGSSSGSFAFDDSRALELYPSRIRYTAHEDGLDARRHIVFEYEDRPDPVDIFRSGVHRRISKRIERIVAMAPNPQEVAEVWSYELDYGESKSSGRSLLRGATLCDAFGKCLPQTEFDYRTAGTAYTRHTTGIEVRDGAHMADMTPADFNGDGRTDLLFWKGQRQWCECVSSDCSEIGWGGSTTDYCYELDTFRVSGEWNIAYSNGSTLSRVEPTGLVGEFVTRTHHVAEQPSATPVEYNKPIVLDFDGDGAADLFSARTGEIRSPARGYALLQDMGSTFEGFPPFWEPDVRYLGDFDGDGRVDLFSNDDRPVPELLSTPEGTEVTHWHGPFDWSEYDWSYQLGGGEPGFGPRLAAGIRPVMQRFDAVIDQPAIDPVHHSISMDVDGDGRTELALPAPGNTYRTFEVAADGTPELGELNLSYLWHSIPGARPVSEYVPIYLDINGDGLRDLIASGGVDIGAGRIELFARINTGQGFGPWYVAAPAGYRRPPSPWETGGPAIHDNGVRVLDYNADGRDDFVVPGEDGADPLVYLSDGLTFHSIVPDFELEHPAGMHPPSSPYRYIGYTHRIGDIDGDGLPDLFQLDLASKELEVWRRGSIDLPDTLMHVRNGIDRNESLVRRTLNDRKVYRPGAGCSYPQRCLRSGRYVISLLERSGADGGTDYFEYSYEDARVDMTGRGFLGFRQRTERVVDADIITTIDYGIDRREHGTYPLAGLPVKVRTDVPIDATSSQTTVEETGYRVFWNFGYQTYMVRAHRGTRHVHEVPGPPPASPRPENADRVETVVRSWNGYGDMTSEASVTSGRIIPEGGGPYHVMNGKRTQRGYAYDYDEDEWLMGVLTRTSVSSYDPLPSSRSETRTTEIVPDAHGRPYKVIVEPSDPRLRHETTYHYGRYGELESVTRENSAIDPEAPHEIRTDTFEYDAESLYPRLHCNALRHCSRLAVHPAHGVLVMADDPNGHRTAMTYDGFGRQRGVSTAEGYQQWIDHESGWAGPYLVRVRTSDGAERTTEYNRAGAPFKLTRKSFDGRPAVQEIVYDHLGRAAQVSNVFVDPGDRRWTKFEFDGLDRIVRTDNPDGSSTRTDYSIDEQRSWDAEGNESYVRFDVNGRVTDSVDLYTEDGSKVRTRYSYAPFDRLETVTDPLGHVKTMTYDSLGRRLTIDDPDAGLRTFTYNGFGEIIEETTPESRAAGVPTTYDRDLLGRVLAIHSTDGSETQIWDLPPAGSSARTWLGARQATISADGTETRFEYDAYGRLERERTRVDGRWYEVDYDFDGRSRLSEIHYPLVEDSPRFMVSLDYGVNGALARISTLGVKGEATQLWEATERNAYGRSTHELYGSRLEAFRTYEVDTGRLDVMRARQVGASSDLFRYDHGYDDNGNPTSRHEQISGFRETFAYDSLDRLDGWRRGPAKEMVYHTQYEYDHAGNLLRRWDRGGTEDVDEVFHRALLGDDRDALTGYERWEDGRQVTDTGMKYDRNGRRVEGPWERVEYTSFDLPRMVVQDGDRTQYLYDGNRRQVASFGPTEKRVRIAELYELRESDDGVEHVFLVHADSGVVAQVVQKEGESEREILYTHRDHRGSAAVVTDEAGRITTGQWFTPFGQRTSGEGRPSYGAPTDGLVPGFTGHRGDPELGLIDMNGRIYDPVGSTFLTPDPVVSRPLFGQDHNRYAYVLNNPLKYTDPTGLWERVPEDPGLEWEEDWYDPETGETVDMAFKLARVRPGDDNLDDVGSVDDTGAPGGITERTDVVEFEVWASYVELEGLGEQSWLDVLLDRPTPTGIVRHRDLVGRVSLTISYTSEGEQDVRADVDVDHVRPGAMPNLAIGVSATAAVRPVGSAQEVAFQITIEGPALQGGGFVTNTDNSTGGSGTLAVGPVSATGSAPTSSTARRSSRSSSAAGDSHQARGVVRIPTDLSLGISTFMVRSISENARVHFRNPGREVDGYAPFVGAASIELVGPF